MAITLLSRPRGRLKPRTFTLDIGTAPDRSLIEITLHATSGPRLHLELEASPEAALDLAIALTGAAVRLRDLEAGT